MEKYYLGFDIGTSSVGWALTDENYKVVRKKGKSLWGVNLFDEASTQQERRTKRSNRRRIMRRKQRITLLQSLFVEEINKIDASFYQKLNSSFCVLEDKDNGNKYNLFNDANFTDKNYYNYYPTIYHLRKALIEQDKKFDIRLIYLALHHMVKYRGHFNMVGQNFDSANVSFYELFNQINEIIESLNLNESFNLPLSFNEDFIKIITEVKGISRLKEALVKYFNCLSKQTNSMVMLLSGGTVKMADLFDKIEYKDLETIAKFSFSSSDYDEKVEPILLTNLGEDADLIYKLKEVYDLILLKRLIGDKEYISFAMVERFNKHSEDLVKLKKYIVTTQKDLYNDIFRYMPNSIHNYSKYIGSNNSNNQKESFSHCTVDEFYLYLKKKLDIKPGVSEYFDSILSDMESKNYLPRLNSSSNGVFPYQLNEVEMKTILHNQSKYYPFLLKSDAYGTIMDKIISILTFKIPYYVGPLNKNSNKAWLVRKDEKIYPWNFKDVVNMDASAVNFIKRMTNKCTYLFACDTLPMNSLIYSEYLVLQELNKININGAPIQLDVKQKVLEEFYKKNKKITISELTKFLNVLYSAKVIITTSNDKDIKDFKANLASYITFKDIFKEDFEKRLDDIEKIISEITIFEDKEILVKRLKNVYGLSDEKIKAIKSLNYKGWGNLSKELLCDLKGEYVDSLGEVKEISILDLMRNTNQNLIEVINNINYNFKEKIDQYNGLDDKVDQDFIDKLSLSPAAKRAVNQALLIDKELRKIIKAPINKYFIECNRSDGKKNDTKDSRKQQLKDVFNNCKKILEQYEGISKEEMNQLLDHFEKQDNRSLKSKKLYLYFMQLGKSAYSLKPIDLNNLVDYDIDHIIPQSAIKDDSLSNTVLVEKEINHRKSDKYPLTQDIIHKDAKSYWKFLKDLKLMDDAKYSKLTRTDELSDEELSGFINRQLVMTSQMTKNVATVLTKMHPESNVIWSKAGNVSDFRNNDKIKFAKCRETNDFHHAHDAYLNIVVGNTLNTRFGYAVNAKKIKEMKADNETVNVKRVFESNVRDYQKHIVWNAKETPNIVLKQLNNHDIMVTKKLNMNYGKLYKETLFSPKGDKKDLMPIKGKGTLSDSNKYGGYSNVLPAYFCIVKSLSKGKEKLSFEVIPTYVSINSNLKVEDYLKEQCNLTEPQIVVDKIYKNTIITNNGFEAIITGGSDRNNFTQTYWKNEDEKYIKKMMSLCDKQLNEEIDEYIISIGKNLDGSKKIDSVSKERNGLLYTTLLNNFQKKPFNVENVFISLATILTNGLDAFKSLTLKNQCIVLSNIIAIQKCDPVRKDLSLIGGPKDVGRLNGNGFKKGCKVITKSVTGFYQKIIFEY